MNKTNKFLMICYNMLITKLWNLVKFNLKWLKVKLYLRNLWEILRFLNQSNNYGKLMISCFQEES